MLFIVKASNKPSVFTFLEIIATYEVMWIGEMCLLSFSKLQSCYNNLFYIYMKFKI